MNEEVSFIAAFRENPAELTTLLVFADWLDEHARHREAEFLRVLADLIQGGLIEAERNRLLMRMQTLRTLIANEPWMQSFGSPLFLPGAVFPLSVEEEEARRREQERVNAMVLQAHLDQAEQRRLERERQEREREAYRARRAGEERARVAKEAADTIGATLLVVLFVVVTVALVAFIGWGLYELGSMFFSWLGEAISDLYKWLCGWVPTAIGVVLFFAALCGLIGLLGKICEALDKNS